MKIKVSSKRKEYEIKLRSKSRNFISQFKPRFNRFPWKMISKVPNRFNNQIVTVSGHKYTVKSLKKEISNIHNKLKMKIKPNAFNNVIMAYNKDAKTIKEENLSRIYSNYDAELDRQFKEIKQDLYFCLEAMKEIRKFLGSAVKESCEDVESAREFVREVSQIAKKYDANYFIVTDGASGTHNNGNKAVEHARNSHKEWEKKHGFDPEHDWSKIEESEETIMGPVLMTDLMEGYDQTYGQFIRECALNVVEREMQGDDIDIYEGANTDNFTSFKEALVGVGNDLKTYRQLCKKKEYMKAKKVLQSAIAKLNKAEKEIKACEGDELSSILGFGANYLHGICEGTILGLFGALTLGLLALPAALAALAINVKDIIQGLTNIINELKKGKVSTADALNLYRQKLLMRINDIRGILNKMIENTDAQNAKVKTEAARAELGLTDELVDDLTYVDESFEIHDAMDDIKEMIESCAMDEFEFEEDDEEEFTEGVNRDSKKIYKAAAKEYKKHVKAAKKYAKQEMWKEAKAELAKADKDLAKKYDAINACEGDLTSAIIGFFAYDIKMSIGNLVAISPFLPGIALGVGASVDAAQYDDLAEGLFGTILTQVSGAGAWIVSFVRSLKKSFEQICQMIDNVKNREELTVDAFNLYRNNLLAEIKNLRQKLRQLERRMNSNEKVARDKAKEEIKKEAAEFEEMVTFEDKLQMISEAVLNDDMDEAQLDALIESALEEEEESPLTELFEAVDVDETKQEQFKKVKLALYEKCGSGEITVEERESLITEAYKRFFETTEEEKPMPPSQKPLQDQPSEDGTPEQEAKKAQEEVDKKIQQMK